ncbi:MAG: acyl-CoA thioesterase [Pyrinomonadaceae bacterium]
MRFSHSFKVGKGDIDVHDHVNNVAYLRWIQDVAVAHWLNAASAELQKKYTWYVLRHEIDYKDRAFENDEVTATTWVGHATKIKCERFTEIKRGGNLLVSGKSIWCLLDITSNKPSKITEELKEIFGMQ